MELHEQGERRAAGGNRAPRAAQGRQLSAFDVDFDHVWRDAGRLTEVVDAQGGHGACLMGRAGNEPVVAVRPGIDEGGFPGPIGDGFRPDRDALRQNR